MLHQQQVILRNDSSPTSVAQTLLKLALAWRKARVRPFRSILAPLASALLISGGFFVAGLFSSEVTSAASKDMLLRSSVCGLWTYGQVAPGAEFYGAEKTLNESLAAAEYVKNCYGGSPTPFKCNLYVTQQISWKVNQSALCPFASGTCVYGNNAALELDTGPLDSNDVFGLNAPQSHRITYRKVTTCAPILLTPSRGEWRTPPSTYLGSTSTSWTYEYYPTERINGLGYLLYSWLDGTGWEAAAPFSRADGNVTLFFLAQNVVDYKSKVDDPWFGAHQELNLSFGGVYSTVYQEDFPVTILGCLDQHQFCNPRYPGFNGESTGCTALTSATKVYDDLAGLKLNDYQSTTIWNLNESLVYANTWNAVNGRGASALQASNKMAGLLGTGLPPTQWMTEVSGVVCVYLSSTAGQLSPNTSVGHDICRSQKVSARDGYQNFSVLGISIIIGVGTLIIIIGLTIDTIVGWMQTKFKRGEYRLLSWELDDKLQLQRMAYEGAGWGPWKDHSGFPIKEGVAEVGRYEREKAHASISLRTGSNGELGHEVTIDSSN
ncbi:hypothetical protein CLAIMM_03951 [Cladophialophora immunda]|nr:hypothetical protein CLAIMM_03951 [Cladophialophora immunda]